LQGASNVRRFRLSQDWAKFGHTARPQDVIGFGIYVTSFFGATVRWRGADYRVTSDGTLIEGQDLSKAET
jgi:hypothetical protein